MNCKEYMDGYMCDPYTKGYNLKMFPDLEHYEFCEATDYAKDWLKSYIHNLLILYVRNIKFF